jgi:chorismate-pyruvate lyase
MHTPDHDTAVPGGFPIRDARQLRQLMDLPPYLRTLMVTDGTVTNSLEAYFWEQVAVQNLGQQVTRLDRELPQLELHPGDSVLRRRVRLVGTGSQRPYVFAESFLRLELLPDGLRQDIEAGKLGIGELLRECELETYRELLDFGVESVGGLAELLQVAEDDPLVYRTYRIAFHHHPMILITEKFPLARFAPAD